MKAIGGYFHWELPLHGASYMHQEGIHLNSGRNALEYILRSLNKVSCLWIPYYTCDVVLEPIQKLNIPYQFYHINEQLELLDHIPLKQDEYLLATNYFGIKDAYMKQLASLYGKQLIIDNAQALYAAPIEGVKTVYSPRKFVGVSDGGIAYMQDGMDISAFGQDVSYERCSHLLKRLDLGAEAAYADFRENSHQLVNQPVLRMSNLTETLLKSIDFNVIKTQRIENFNQLHQALGKSNLLSIPSADSYACPMVYPYYTSDKALKGKLISNKIFAATYWPNVLNWSQEDTLEYTLADNIIAIPIDQRYGICDIENIIDLINK